jgi:hypothetical protein
VYPDEFFDVVKMSASAHRLRSSRKLFGRLKDDNQLSWPRPGSFQSFGSCQNHGGIRIMTASMDRTVFTIYLDGQRIHVGTQGYGPPRSTPPQTSYHTRLRHPFLDDKPRGTKLVGEEAGGFMLRKTDFRHSVQSMKQLSNFAVVFGVPSGLHSLHSLHSLPSTAQEAFILM